MSIFLERKNGELHFDGFSLSDVAKKFSTPCYVYSKNLITENFKAYNRSFRSKRSLICYAVKANPNIAILQLLAELGAGFDVTSEGELNRVIYAGGDPKKIIFSGVGKSKADIRQGLIHDIHCFNVESKHELLLINQLAGDQNKKASVSLRVNPDINVQTHPYIATGLKNDKFGIDINDAHKMFHFAKDLKNINLVGIACHIGSLIYDVSPFKQSLKILLTFLDKLKVENIHLSQIDIGGGLGVLNTDACQETIQNFSEAISSEFGDRTEQIILEPGRSIIGNAGLLLMKVEHTKRNGNKNFAIVDAGMNDYIRPALYQSEMKIESVISNSCEEKIYEIVGPVCESGDFLGKNRLMSIKSGDILCLIDAGAYGFAMASNYNSRYRPPEIIISNQKLIMVRKRESFEDITRNESLIN